MAGLLDAAMIVLIFHMVHTKANASVWEKAFCVTMLFWRYSWHGAWEAQHARAFQVICGLGVILPMQQRASPLRKRAGGDVP